MASCPIGQEHLGHSWPIVIPLMQLTFQLQGTYSFERQSTQFGLSQTGTEWLTKVCLEANKHETRRR